MSYESLISLRYLKSGTGRGFLSVIGLISILGVLLGVASLDVVLSVMKGFEDELRDKIIGASSHVVVMSYEGDFGDFAEVEKRLARLPGVASTSPFIYNHGMLVTEYAVSGSVIRGIDPNNSAAVAAVAEAVGKGSLPEENKNRDTLSEEGTRIISRLLDKTVSGHPPIIIGTELSNLIGAAIGDTVNLVSPYGKIGPFGPTAKIRKFSVIGVFDYGMIEYDSSTAYVSLEDAMNFFETKSRITGIEVRVDDIYQARKTGDEITETLGFPFYAKNWEDSNRSLFRALRLERMAIGIFLGFIVLVAALNIVSTLTMLVMEKKRDIAVLISMGARKSGIRRIFVYDGMIIGTAGTLLGTLFGYLICRFLETSNFIKEAIPFDDNVYPISEFPVRIEPVYFLVVAASSLLICFLATLYPSYRASRENPVESLRYE
jgi:lipoprotein-releasing system permease protein